EAIAHESQCRVTGDKLLEHLQRLRIVRDRIATSTDELAALELLAEHPTFTCTYGRREHWADKQAVVDALQRAQDAAVATVERVARPAFDHLVHHVVSFVRASAEERRRVGQLEFHDLLVCARDLVRADARVRAILHGRYERLLLDEFQDTDPLQIELAVLIATDD